MINSAADPSGTEYDVIVVGAGCAGLAAALFATLAGLRALVIERTPYIGGTTALSAGAIWIPNTPQGRTVNPDDTPERAACYLARATSNRAAAALRESFLRNGPKAVETLTRQTDVALRPFAYHPDYLSELDGSTVNGRVLQPEPFDGRLLGDDLDRVRPPIPEFTVLGGMMVDRTDIGHLMGITRSGRSAAHALRLIGRHAVDRLRGRRSSRMVMGNALIGRLLLSLRKRGVAIWCETQLVGLDRAVNDGVAGVTIRRNGATCRLRAKLGVILASGGFNRNAALRKRLIPPLDVFSPGAPGHTGEALDLAFGLGAKLGDDDRGNHAFWAPVSVRRRKDGSEAVFPHFVLDRAKPGTVVVNRSGRRFLNESLSYHAFACGMIETHRTSPSIPAFLIADHRAVVAYGLGMARPGGHGLGQLIAQGYLVRDQTIAGLAWRLGVDGAALAETIANMNRFASTGVDEEFRRGSTAYQRNLGDPRVAPNPTLGPVARAPFYGVRLFPGDIGASTGLVTDAAARVLRDGVPISGLYAIGNDMNSVMAGAYPAPGITLGPAIAFAYAAIKHVRGMA